MRFLLGLLLAFGVGVLCRLLELPLPAPLALTGAVLVLAMSAGYELVDRLAPHEAVQRANCGGPDVSVRTNPEVSRRTIR
jgi:XapX domain-containing protein